MKRMLTVAKRFLKEEDAPTMVEYGLMLALIAVVCIVAVTAIGNNLVTIFNAIKDKLVVPG